MAQSTINLIPKQEKSLQQRESVVHTSSIISIVLLILVAGLSGFLWYQQNQLKQQISAEDTRIESLRTDVSAQAEIEIAARSLDSKYQILRDIFSTRRDYSVLLSELQKRIPEGVRIDSLGLSGEANTSLNISGTGTEYLSIARFINTLSDIQYPGADEELVGLFTDVSLNTVTLDSQSLEVSYFIVAKFDESLLIK